MERHASSRLPQRRSDDWSLGPPIGVTSDQPCSRPMWTRDVRRQTSRKRGVSPVLVTFPESPSRPGRLVAVTTCPGRHETPGTQLGRTEPAANDAVHSQNPRYPRRSVNAAEEWG